MAKPKAASLSAVWDRPDTSVLMPKQVSIRLSANVAAKLAALGEMYPRISRTELINDLLASALIDFESGLESFGDEETAQRDSSGELVYIDYYGSRPTFQYHVQKQIERIEKELGISLTSKASDDDRSK